MTSLRPKVPSPLLRHQVMEPVLSLKAELRNQPAGWMKSLRPSPSTSAMVGRFGLRTFSAAPMTVVPTQSAPTLR